MSPNYGRHILPTNLGGKPKFACTLRGSEVHMVDCNNCSTPCVYAGESRNSWCVLYTPKFCLHCKAECSMRVEDVPDDRINEGPKGYSEYYREQR